MKVGNWSMAKTFVLLKVLIVVIVVISIGSLSFTYYASRHFMEDAVRRYDHLYQIFRYNEQFRSLAHDSLFSASADGTESYAQCKQSFEADFDRLMESVVLSSTKTYLQGLRNMFQYYFQSIDQMLFRYARGQKALAYEAYQEAEHRSDLIKEVVVKYDSLYSADMVSYTQSVTADFGRIQGTQVAGSLLILVSALAFLSATLHRFTQGMLRLTQCTEHIAVGDYDFANQQRFSPQSDWGRLGMSIQHMAAKIQFYLGEMEEKNRLTVEMATMENERLRMRHSIREAELKALNNQMSPHFIYNTLNIALQLAYQEKADKTVEMMRAMIEFMRYYAKSTSSIIDLYSEIQFVRNYVFISQKRYEERIAFSIQVEQDVPNVKIPAVTIQPLVENAIIHGLKDCAEQGSIGVRIFTAEDMVIVSVEDNGKGIEYERIEELMSAEGESNDHLGLKNVKQRLQLFFGERATLGIDSQLNCGTVVTLRFPTENGGGKHERQHNGFGGGRRGGGAQSGHGDTAPLPG